MTTKSAPFSMRLSADADALIAQEARRTKRSKGAVVAALAEEALKTRLFPGIAFREEDWDRRAWIIGTGFDVWQAVQAWQDFREDAERMAAMTDLTERNIRLALAYYERFPEEIDAAVAENRLPLDELQRRYPHIDVIIYE